MTDEKQRERENILGSGDSFETSESPLQPISASQACGGAPWEVGRRGAFREGREGENEGKNGSKWSWRAVEHCSLLLAVMNRPSEQTGEIGPRWAPEPLSSVRCVFAARGNAGLPVDKSRLPAHAGIHSNIKSVILWDSVLSKGICVLYSRIQFCLCTSFVNWI